MKKLTMTMACFMLSFAVCSAETEFISVPKTKRVLGNDYFSYIEKVFTGVSGEKGSGQRVYLCKEHEVELDEYDISKFLVTNEEYNIFRMETNYKTEYEKNPGTKNNPVLKNIVKQNYPVRRINFMDAIAYAQWRSDNDKDNNYRLPTNAEWENAAIDYNKNLYPWGNEDKILASTMTDSETNRYEYPVDSITEDCSYLGMRNLMGGYEITMDLYNTDFFTDPPKINPVCLDGVDFMTRGIEYYNRMYEEQMGLFGFLSCGFDSFGNTVSFRLVKDNNAIFNKGTPNECSYYLNRGNSKTANLQVYSQPNGNDKKDVMPIKDKDIYILYKSLDNQFYWVFYCTTDFIMDGYLDLYHYGWVKAEDINLNNKKWYEQN